MQWIRSNFWLTIYFVLILGSHLSNAQLQASNWYFGENAGINFDPVSGAVTPLLNGQLSTAEGCASISDKNGNLLFYTDGSTVFNSIHQVMQNGTGLRGNPSSTQSAIIIPKPQDPNIYYIFTVNTFFQGSRSSREINYYEVDMSLNLGLGAVTTNVASPNLLSSFASEKLTAINKANSDDILVTFLEGANGNFTNYVTYTVDSNGVNPTPVVSPSFTSTSDPRGYLKISPDGNHMISCNAATGTFLYDYDNITGLVSNERRLLLSGNIISYGAEFSPDSRLVYITTTNSVASTAPPADHSSTLFQFEVDSPLIGGGFISGIEIDTRQGYRGSLQLGIDGKIYRALSKNFDTGSEFLGVINNPNVVGTGCNYQHDAIALAGRLSTQGLPSFIQNFFARIKIENTCFGDLTIFSFQSDRSPLSIFWDFGDGTTSNLENPTHTYAVTGIYTVTLTLNINGTPITHTQNIEIVETPVANSVNDIELCDLDGDNSELINFDQDIAPIILGTQNPTLFNIRFYTTQQDADNNTNQVTSPFLFNGNTGVFYSRISNSNNAKCYNTTSFNVTLFEQPIAFNIDTIEFCDDDTDGISSVDLTSNDATVLGIQSPTTFKVSYHLSQEDADNDLNPLTSPYTNSNAGQELIFVRIENRNNPNCFDTSQSFDLIINPIPDAFDTNIFQCDEDENPDGSTTFNLSQFNDSITGAAASVSVSYHSSINNATNNISPLNETSYTNTNPSEIIYARVINDITNCINIAQITLEISVSDVQNTQLETCDDDGNEDGFTEFILTDADASVLMNAPANVTVNYYDSLNDALIEQNTLPTQYTNTTANNQVIYARAESLDGNCFGISKVTLIVNNLPIVEPVDLIDHCGNNPESLTIDAGNLPGNITDYTYSWDTGETSYSIQVSNAGNYVVNVTNVNGCVSTRIVTVIISDAATINSIDVIHAGNNSFGSATINTSGLGDYEYRIDLDHPFQDSPVFENLSPGIYTAYVKDKNGCDTTRQEFAIIGYPRFFTPNNDGFNDFWQLIGTNTVFEPNTKIFILDRYGKLLKQITADSIGWDGTYNNNPMPSNDYWFRVTLSNGNTFSSHFTLKR